MFAMPLRKGSVHSSPSPKPESAIRAQPFPPAAYQPADGNRHQGRRSELAKMVAGTVIIGYADPNDEGRGRFAIGLQCRIAQLDREPEPVPQSDGQSNGE